MATRHQSNHSKKNGTVIWLPLIGWLLERLDALVALVSHLSAQLVILGAQIGDKDDTIRALSDELATLKARMSKDSHNSSKPPSTDGFRKKTKSLREPSTRPTGGQKGHTGHTLAWVEKPTNVVVCELPAHCEHCDHSLADCVVSVVEKRQVIDLPVIVPDVTEYQIVSKACPSCLHLNISAFPPTVTETIQYGPRIKSAAVFLNQWHNLPYLRTTEIIESLFHVSISEGTLRNWIAKAADFVRPQVETIKQIVLASPVVHADESGMRVAKKLYWLHTLATTIVTWYGVHCKRGMEAIKAFDILPRYCGILVHDCFSPYWKLLCQHALCNTHLLRELKYIAETTAQEWPERMAKFLVASNKLRLEADRQGEPLSTEAIAALTAQYERLLAQGEKLNPRKVDRGKNQRGRIKQSEATNLLGRLRKHANEVLRFLGDINVPFTNNEGERGIRMPKVQQKVSGCFRSEAGASDYFTLRSYNDTMHKQGHDVFVVLQNVFMGTIIAPGGVGQ